jgi:hypothetical protein
MMTYWDDYQLFHSHGFKDIAEWRPYKSAVDALEKIFKPLIKDEDMRYHPALSRFMMGYLEHYKWMDQFARVLLRAQSIPGIEKVWSRLASPVEYQNALSEIETSLLFALAGNDVRFVDCCQCQTPDLIVKLNGEDVNVEITSLNSSDLDNYVMLFMNAVMRAQFEKKIVTCGHLNAPRKKSDIDDVISEFNEAVLKASEGETIENVLIPGLANIWVASKKGDLKLPPKGWGSFSFGQRYGRSIEERIERKIHEKTGQLTHDNKPSILFIHSRVQDMPSDLELYISQYDRIESFLATCPGIVELILIGPETFTPQVSYSDSPLSSNKVCLSYPSINWRERPCVVWTNKYSEYKNDISTVQLIQDLSNYIKNLPSLT